MEKERPNNYLWTPAEKLFSWGSWNLSEIHDEEEDPDLIQGLDPSNLDDLGMPHRRDPDALPPRNTFEWAMNRFHRLVTSFGGGNALYAVKAGILTGKPSPFNGVRAVMLTFVLLQSSCASLHFYSRQARSL